MHAPATKSFFTAGELAVKAHCGCDKSLETNLKTKEPYIDHTDTQAN